MELTELIDINELQEICESFTAQTSAATALLDLHGNILISTGWKDICTRFHRVHPATAQRCHESDTDLAGRLKLGEPYNVYKCKNGLVDVAVPIIIEGTHIANFFTGQFFFEPPDREYFIRQADEFGFDRDSYLDALHKVPIFSEAHIQELMRFFTRLTGMVTKMGLVQKKQAETLIRLEQEIARRHQAQEELAVKHAKLEELNKTLEQRVNTAVAELRVKDQLMVLQNRQAAMGEMINNIAHQWKQPLNNLGLITQSIASCFEEGLLTTEEMEAGSNTCFELISHMSQTIEDFRHFFRIDRNKEAFGIRKIFNYAALLMSASLKDNNITIVVEPGEEVYAIGYPNEFAQVVLNLLVNAKDVFIERKTSKPIISVRIVTEGELAVVIVGDNGGGIAPKIIGQIFNPDFTTKEFDKGTGIGLFMSKNIIEQHLNGSLTVKNFGNGAQFRIEIPKGAAVEKSA